MSYLTEDDVFKQFQREIKARLGAHLKKVILFCSKARDDDTKESDYDFLVLVDKVTPTMKDAIDEIAGGLLFEHNAVFSIFPVSEETYAQRRFDPFLNNVRREGVIL